MRVLGLVAAMIVLMATSNVVLAAKEKNDDRKARENSAYIITPIPKPPEPKPCKDNSGADKDVKKDSAKAVVDNVIPPIPDPPPSKPCAGGFLK